MPANVESFLNFVFSNLEGGRYGEGSSGQGKAAPPSRRMASRARRRRRRPFDVCDGPLPSCAAEHAASNKLIVLAALHRTLQHHEVRFADIKRRAHDLTPRRRPSLGDIVLWALLMQRGDANLLAEPACVDSESEESDRPGDDDEAVLAPSFDALAAALSRSLERIESTCAVMERSLNTATQRTRRSDEP